MLKLAPPSLLAALLGAAAPAVAQAPESSAAGVRPPAAIVAPDIVYRERTLANGMRVFALRDATTPNVAVQVFYGVGAKDDPHGRSGFAHLFEHLMFKRTRNMPDEMMDRLTEDVGGSNNASTADDFTNYYEVVPANHLQRILWAEAERMGSLVVDDRNFASERDVVKEELRQRVFANPYGRFLRYLIPESSFAVHPYRRSGIGSIADLDAATLDDVRAFHRTYYRPDNAALIVAGNFEPAALDRWIDAYFGPLARPVAPLPRVTVEEPSRTGPRTVTGYGPNVPLPAVAVTWPAPPASHPDAAPLAVLDAVLSAGESSRLYESLVYRQQLAQTAFSSADLRQQPGLFMAAAILASGKTVEAGEAALLAEVARVRDAPISGEELAEAKTEFTASALRQRETNEGKSYAIGVALTVENDPARANTALDEIAAVTAADVQRVARQYLDPERRVAIRYLSESARPAGEAAAAANAAPERPSPPTAAPSAGAATLPAAPAFADGRTEPPPVGPAVRVAVPVPVERTLANGLKVIVATDRDAPLVTARVLIRSGAEVDPARLAGLSNMTATLLTKGAGDRSATEIAQAVERLGASLDAGAGWDGVYVDLDALAPNLESSAAILAEVVRRPTFGAEELERERQQTLDALQVSLQQPGSVASLVVNPLVFAGDAYGHPAGGTPESLARITRADVQSLHRTWYRPDNAALILAGDITPEAGFALAQRLFGDWARPRTRLPAAQDGARPGPLNAPRQPSDPGPRVVVIDMPESGQAAVYFARPGAKRGDPALPVAEVADSVLGGGYSARLNQEVRIRRGLSYGARSFIDARRRNGLLGAVVQTKNESADEVVDVLLSEFERLRTERVAPSELAPRKAVLVGGFGRELETGGGLAGLISDLALHGRPLSELNRYLGRVEGVTPEQIEAYARPALSPSGATVIVVGDAKAFLPDLRRRFPKAEVIPAAELKLDSPTLR